MVGRDYPSPNGEGIEYVRRKWKEALRDPENCRLLILPTIIANDGEKKWSPEEDYDDAEARAAAMENERIVRKAVGRGRYVSTSIPIVPVCVDGEFYPFVISQSI